MSLSIDSLRWPLIHAAATIWTGLLPQTYNLKSGRQPPAQPEHLKTTTHSKRSKNYSRRIRDKNVIFEKDMPSQSVDSLCYQALWLIFLFFHKAVLFLHSLFSFVVFFMSLNLWRHKRINVLLLQPLTRVIWAYLSYSTMCGQSL